MFSNFLQPHIIYPTRIVSNAKPSLIDNIFSNCLNCDVISGNLIDKISDHLPNFVLVQNQNHLSKKIKYQKRDFSKFNEQHYLSDLFSNDVFTRVSNATDVNRKYEIFDTHL